MGNTTPLSVLSLTLKDDGHSTLIQGHFRVNTQNNLKKVPIELKSPLKCFQLIYRAHTEYLQDTYSRIQASTGHLQSAYRAHTGHLQGACRAYTEHLQGAYRAPTELCTIRL